MIDHDPSLYDWHELLDEVRGAYTRWSGVKPDRDFPDCVLIGYIERMASAPTVGALVEAVLDRCAERYLLRKTPNAKRDDPIGFVGYMLAADLADIERQAEKRQRAEQSNG